MNNIGTWLSLIGLSVSLLSCLDHRGVPPDNQQRSRLKYRYEETGDLSAGTLVTTRYGFSYDTSGRLVEVGISTRLNSVPFSDPTSRSILPYDAGKKLQRETYVNADGNFSAYFTFEYDSLSRLDRVLSFGNTVEQTMTYDAEGRVNSRTFYTYRRGEVASTSLHSYTFDSRNNITIALITVWAEPGRGLSSSRYKVLTTFDQTPNPVYHLPTTTFGRQTFNTNSLYSANNAILETQLLTDQLTGDFPTDATIVTITHEREYKNGLLSKDTVKHPAFTTVFRYEYEPY